MGRLKLDFVVLTFALVLVNCVVQSQYFIQQPRPLYFVQEDPELQASASDELVDIQGSPSNQFLSRKGVPQAESEEDDDEDEDDSSAERHVPAGRSRPVQLPPGFDESVKRKMQVSKMPKRPLHGDPSSIHQDDDDEGRRPESRLLWPFSIEITKGDKGGEGWGGGGPGKYGSHHHHHHHGGGHHGGHQGGHHGHHGGHQGHGLHAHHKRGHHKFQISAGHRNDHGAHDGWGWDSYIEHEKHKLKYEILKLKAKKKIAILQNKVELKKLLSMLLQKKIQALEWCYTSWAANGWGNGQGGGNGGWGGGGATKHPYNYGWGEEKGLTDEQILKSKHYKKYQKKKKKKIKKLKKKLKFKRLIQKILQKHITYLDKIAPY